MIIRRAELKDVPQIMDICSRGWQETYKDLVPHSYIDQVIEEYYNEERVTKDVLDNSPYYYGYWVAVEDDKVLGCIGGGIDDNNEGHIYVLYVDPNLKRRGIGSHLVDAFTAYQKETYGIEQQWITSAMEGNQIGLSFYEKQGFVFQYATESKQDPSFPKGFHLKRQV
ncbi:MULTISPECIES: GNAT family N-acetyltransferase [Streptococcus]|uniref:GNAT family N-acetyltransferase n=1 Tax=Streptococcus caledonicus TaxID=2614158 RepID=A0ABW0UCZ6_9STRE|nr:GNAT family N-acetyltransferase [Streptococcus sp. S784/96/1]